jgi:Arc/MetJ-type ribon-helix-helix transcriptional regulator
MMAAVTVGFAIADEDRALLEDLVSFYADGNRSEFLRIAMKKMARDRFAKRLTDLQASIKQDLNGRVYSTEEVVAMCKAVNAELA